MTNTALITGAAHRIGACIAEYLHAQGMNIGIHYRDSRDEALRLAQKLNQLRPDSAVICQADLHDTMALAAIVDLVAEKWGTLTLLVNNASGFYATPLGNVTETQWDDLQASNVKGAFFLSQAAFPHLKATQGAIINITDIHAQKPLKNYLTYSIAKAGLVTMTKALAREMAPYVRVNAVAPGTILWPEAENTLNETQKSEIIERTLLKRQGSPTDIAATVHFLCQSNYITGQIIAVDGGASLR